MQFFFSLLLAAHHAAPACPRPRAGPRNPGTLAFRTTYIRQIQPAFHSGVDGPHSLRADTGASYSLTATASLGLRLGPSTEIYVDPEAVQGVPLSGLFGLAAFPNGELAKTSGAALKLYRARLFVRHTFELGGAAVDVDSDANQLKARYDARRLVVTAGNVSVLDLFDASGYSHDPRTQFMNWSLMTYGAYDYPADARGYTNGLAVDYDDGPWTLRAGRFAEPLKPNGLPLDNDLLRHYGDQVELVHTHTFGALAGAVRVLAFRSRTRIATYEDALAAAPAGAAPDLDAVRTGDHVKAGIGIDAEQQVANDLGLFVRAMRADGKTETYAFTESDASLSARAVAQGQPLVARQGYRRLGRRRRRALGRAPRVPRARRPDELPRRRIAALRARAHGGALLLHGSRQGLRADRRRPARRQSRLRHGARPGRVLCRSPPLGELR